MSKLVIEFRLVTERARAIEAWKGRAVALQQCDPHVGERHRLVLTEMPYPTQWMGVQLGMAEPTFVIEKYAVDALGKDAWIPYLEDEDNDGTRSRIALRCMGALMMRPRWLFESMPIDATGQSVHHVDIGAVVSHDLAERHASAPSVDEDVAF